MIAQDFMDNGTGRRNGLLLKPYLPAISRLASGLWRPVRKSAPVQPRGLPLLGSDPICKEDAHAGDFSRSTRIHAHAPLCSSQDHGGSRPVRCRGRGDDRHCQPRAGPWQARAMAFHPLRTTITATRSTTSALPAPSSVTRPCRRKCAHSSGRGSPRRRWSSPSSSRPRRIIRRCRFGNSSFPAAQRQ